MTSGTNREQDFQVELQELLHSMRSMAEGNFYRLVNVRARGVVGELAAYVNQAMRNLQSLDPAVKSTSREIPKVAQHLAEIIRTTEEATNRVLEEAEHLVEEQSRVEQGLSRVAEALRHQGAGVPPGEAIRQLEEVRELQCHSHGRAMDIMAAMEFQDLTTQKIQRLISLVAEVESRLLQLLVMFRLEETPEQAAADPIIQTVASDDAALCKQDLVDQLLGEFQGKRG